MSVSRVAVVVTNRASFARIYTVIEQLEKSELVHLQLIFGGSAVLPRFGRTSSNIEHFASADIEEIHTVLEGDSLSSMARTTGLALFDIAPLLDRLKPDVVVTVADRYETLATAVAASYMNIPLAHTQGGELSGSIDNKVRFAVSQLADFHFPATVASATRLQSQGISSNRIYPYGCPSIDLVHRTNKDLPDDIFSSRGPTGQRVNPRKPYVLFLHHPVTTQFGPTNESELREILAAAGTLLDHGMQIVWLWPNIDAGSGSSVSSIRRFVAERADSPLAIFGNFDPESFVRVLANSQCIVGNSSAGIRESAFLGIPSVNVGERQRNREHASNVVFVEPRREDILSNTFAQVAKGRQPSSNLFGSGFAGEKIADQLVKIAREERERNPLH